MPGPQTRLPNGKIKPPEKPIEILSNGQKVFGRHPVKGYIVCNAIKAGEFERAGYDGKRCMQSRVGLNGRCRKHGMNAGRKPACDKKVESKDEVDPLVNIGAVRYRGVNLQLRNAMLESAMLEKQLSLKPDIAFVDAAIQELSSNLSEVIDRKTLSYLRHLVNEYRFLAENPPEKLGDEVVRLRDLMSRCAMIVESADSYEANKIEVMRLQRHRMSLAEAEGKQQDREAESMRKDLVVGMVLMFADGVLDHLIQTEEQLGVFQQILAQVRERYGDVFREVPAIEATSTASNTPSTDAPIKTIDEEVQDAEWRYTDDDD